ncbi:GNAT family N-acetyltransferase [Veronia pacifica]|uniref:GNAT family N-acetyltransferase n=1 Tax=Veronia pacifica TaxID=1080227 RepID=A0A1C3EQZ4_9GAMM|nr:GNAT family N-acetyltransferase [Veronia pacifica]ODA35632.1 hypothetical protein A8L45_03160 [Veronia pacifica]
MEFCCKVHSTIGAFNSEDWDQLDISNNPFCKYSFFAALEDSDVVCNETGWEPKYIAIYQANTLVAAAPCFIKSHPMGEYVFDWSWSDAYERYGLPYYPKLICAVPFTPVTGPRLMVAPQADSSHLIPVLIEQMKELGRHIDGSGVHILFPDDTVSTFIRPEDLHKRKAVQFHWLNRKYQDFDDFLSQLTSRKRKNIKKERKSIVEQGIEIDTKEGHQISTGDWHIFYQFYRQTYLKRSGHEGYLNQTFFELLGKTMPNNLVMITGIKDDNIVAASLFLKSDTTLFGRYWGCHTENNHLHFELCYYQGIEYCIKHKLDVFEAGAQGEHKLIRGFEPIFTFSYHSLFNPQFNQAIADFLNREMKQVENYLKDAKRYLPYKEI